MADNRMDDQALSQFLDRIVSGEPVAATDGVDSELIETFRALRSLAQTSPAESARHRVGQTVENAIDRIGESSTERLRPLNGYATSVAAADQRTTSGPQRSPSSIRRPSPFDPHPKSFVGTRFVQVMVAGLALISIGLGYLVVGPGLPWNEHRKTIPAAQIVASPTVEPSMDKTLLQITLPAEVMPKGQDVSAGLAHMMVPPGTRSTWTPTCCPGPLIEYVVSGSYSVRAETAIQVVRASGVVIEVAANEEVVLGAGDSLIARNETVIEAANTGASTVELLSWVLIEHGDFGGHSLPGWIEGTADVQGPFVIFPTSMTVTIQRIILAPNDELPSPAAGTTQYRVMLLTNLAGTPVTNTLGNAKNRTLNWGQDPIEVYVLTAAQDVPSAGSPEPGSPTP